MQFESFADFIAMGGYGFYVWLSFGSGLLLIVALIWHSRFQHASVKRDIAKKLERTDKLKRAAQNNQ